jgi:hypothetical protein
MAPGTYIHPNTSEAVIGVVEDMDGVTCTMKEEFPISIPPSLTTIQESDPYPPSLFSPEQLELILDIRIYMVDQVHQDIIIINHIYMLFNACLNAPDK